jgi:P4 family phage/plasmid primase-like protien
VNQEEHIQEVLKMRPSGFDPNVETHRQTEDCLEYGTWEKYQGQKQIDERNPLPNEVVIDIDKGSTEERRKETKKAIKTLQNQGLPFYVTDSGGTGFHVHLFFQLPDGKNWKQMRPYRKAIYQWIKKQAEDNYNADTTGWDEGVVDCNLKGNKGHLIRAVGGRKIETGHRKTTVTPTTMEKKQVEDAENVEYPDSMDLDFWRMSKVDSDGSDLTWKEVNEAAQEIKEEIQEKQKKEIDTNFEAEDDGLQAARELPATEVLKLIGHEVSTGRQIECPIHDDTNPSAKVTDGTESSEMPENRLICFSNTCNSESNTDSQFKMWNGIDILVENGYSFEEAKDKLAEEFDIEIEQEETSQVGDVGNYFKEPESKKGFQPNKLAKEIESDYQFVFNKMQEQLYYYEEGVYKDDGARLVKEECNRRLRNEFKMSRVNDTLNAIKTRPGVAKTKKEFRPPEYKVNFQNGVYDLMKEELVSHREDYYFTSQIPHDYNPDAEGGNVRNFFEEITETEEEAQTLMELSGYAMMPSMPISAAFLLVGKGDNGKTVFLNTLRELIGEEHAKDEDLQQLEHTRFATSSLYRKLLVVSDDMPSTALETGGTLKGITGGGQVRAEFKGGDHFEFKNYATPVFACNDVPETEDQSDGFFRRWTILDFPYKFTENPEKQLEKQKKSEFQLKKDLFDEEQQEAYAYQAIQALQDVLENQGFAAQKPADETRQKWNGYANPVMEFIYKYIEQGVTYNEAQRKAKQEQSEDQNQATITSYDFDYIPKDELFDLVSAYAEARNARPPENKTELKRKLDKADFYFSTARTTQTQFEDGQTQVYRGIRYSEEFQNLLEESESLQEFQGKLKILSASGRMRTHPNVEMRIENQSANPARIDSNVVESYIPDSREPKQVDDILDEIEEEEGYDRSKVENIISRLRSDGIIHEPQPGKLQKM